MSGLRAEARRALYVGYLPMPRAHARFLRVVVPVVMLAVVAGAAAIARQQRAPGAAVWESGEARTWDGTLLESPYPMLVEDGSGSGAGGAPGEVRGAVHLLVEVGKRGAQERIVRLGVPPGGEGVRVRATGWELRRDGRRIIELSPGPEGIVIVASAASPTASAGETPAPRRLEPAPLGEVTLVGEIVDGKCFLGAMKPGDGKGHKSCAVLCLRGGLPPMLATRGADGAVTLRLLTIDGSATLPQRVLDVVAQPVVVRGREMRLGELTWVDASAEGVAPVRVGGW